ncbi:DUF4105 domain-containing protein [Coprobacter tertius]|uniref:DUF4105 domain-containing protein n=1 Tax=Coprobacter tertius TaxID=2944915 RepID=A0ABT1MFQ0_9BACT|nr:DUF4105 domain-containing protein [Coprobacter tertius]MCP9611460.1 DUF4105 domain-containing protein [Coprobacter tertius]
MKPLLLYLFLILAIPFSYGAREDSLRVSLLTCSPGPRSFELFGHSGIRVQGPSPEMDLVFHYGLFDYDAPHFIYRFTKGETDYMMGVTSFSDFVFAYAMRNSGITELELNLSRQEKEDLLRALAVNNLPQNRVYRYNFLYDNCATRPRDIIVKNIQGKIRYEEPVEKTTFRTMIHDCTFTDQWLTFGIDLALGEPLDRPITYQEEMFLPSVLEEAFSKASIIVSQDSIRPLVSSVEEILPASSDLFIESNGTFFSPQVCCWAFFILILGISIYEIIRHRTFRIIDTVVFTVYGLAGCIVAFLMFVSAHPATYFNYSIFWVNPLLLILPVIVWVKKLKKVVLYYHFVNFAVLLCLLVGWAWLPQKMNNAFIPLVLVLAIRSLTNIIVSYRGEK